MALFDQKDSLKLSTMPDALSELPDAPAVFLIWPAEGEPYFARTNVLKRRLNRLLGERAGPSRFLSLRGVAKRVDYWLVSSPFESAMLHYAIARELFPETYLKITKLRNPSYVKLLLGNEYPRTAVTSRLSGGPAVYYGPFRSRAAADAFDSQFLDFFQIRRCEENLAPTPEHPGCIYGEMNMCLRPCQAVVSVEQYASEVGRVGQFLATDGKSLADAVATARERMSEAMNFEEAARQHTRLQKIQKVIGLRDELARDLDRAHGVAVTKGQAGAVLLWFLRRGWWHGPQVFELPVPGMEVLPMDRRLRELIASLPESDGRAVERQEHLALLARWQYSTWRQGEWIGFDKWTDVPYRKLVNAISRVAKGEAEPR